jgi:murein DD-endopeptidase MepM/ murein hydrolase activator NlpD
VVDACLTEGYDPARRKLQRIMNRYRRSTSRRLPLGCLVVAVIIAIALFFTYGFLSSRIANLVNGQPLNATSAPIIDSNGLPVIVTTEELAPDGFPVKVRKHVLKYTVQPGDAIFLIADKFKLSPDTIFWANTDTLNDNVNLIYPGIKLYIMPVDGVYHLSDGKQTVAEVAALYGVTPGDIINSEYNELAQYSGDYVPPAGLRVVVPGGKRGYTSWQSPIRTGSSTGMANPQGTYHPGSCREHYTGVGGTGTYVNPLGDVSYRITQGYYSFHPGADLAGERGTPIHAADTGVVVFAGWHRDGYGELVIIDHGNGWTTYYGHMQTLFVGCGDQITQGQIIGEMGMTGNATGVHLHFEIRDDDSPQDPTRYVALKDSR